MKCIYLFDLKNCLMKSYLLIAVMLISLLRLNAQQLIIMDRENGNQVVNDSTLYAFSSNFNLTELTKNFTIKNNTDTPLALFLKKTVNFMNDSTTDYYCFGVKCWPGNDSTDIADSIQPGAEDNTFASHVCHIRRFEQPPLPPGISSITYTIYDNTSLPDPVEAHVTVIYHLGALGVDEHRQAATVVYPNPASERITVRANENISGKYTLLISNNLGALMQNTSVKIQGKEFSIPVEHYPAGHYSGRLLLEQGHFIFFRFQVVH